MFSVLSVVLTFLIYIYYAGIHGFPSRFSATVGATAPRYVMSSLGLYILILCLLGLIFLAFDIRAREERERMAEVLDTRPVSNTELLVERGLGLVLMAWARAVLAGRVHVRRAVGLHALVRGRGALVHLGADNAAGCA